MIKLRINNSIDRANMITSLVNAGYTVRLEDKEKKNPYLSFDYFVVITDEPELPEYKNTVL